MSKRDITDEEFDRLVSERQHEEMMSIMKRLSIVLENINSNDNLEALLDKVNKTLEKVSRYEPKMDISELSKLLIKLKEEPKKPKEEPDFEQWTFTINRNPDGTIQSVNALKF